MRTVLFAPEDLALVRGDPTERRRFLDELLVTRTPRLAGVRADYDRVLKQRNALLKTARLARGKAIETLDVWDGHLTDFGGQLLAARLQLVADLAPHMARAYAEVAGEGAAVAGLGYSSTVPRPATARAAPGHAPSAAELTAAMRERVAERRRRRAGPRHDAGRAAPRRPRHPPRPGPAKGFASHGESWSLALALSWPPSRCWRGGRGPVLILDDVFADPRRRAPGRAGRGRPLGRADADHRGGDRRRARELRGARYDVADGVVRRVR